MTKVFPYYGDMKKLIFVSLFILSFNSHADCFDDYAYERITQQVGREILTLGLGPQCENTSMGKSVQLITEAIAHGSDQSDVYLKEIVEDNLGQDLEKILIQKSSKQLESIIRSLHARGKIKDYHGVEARQLVAEKIFQLSQSGFLCKDSKVYKFKDLKRQIVDQF